MQISYNLIITGLVIGCIGMGFIIGYLYGVYRKEKQIRFQQSFHEHHLTEMVSYGHIKHLLYCAKCEKYYNKKTGKEVQGWFNGKEINSLKDWKKELRKNND